MEASEYQELCKQTAVYPEIIGLSYVTLGLAGEAGEVANKVKKVYRDSGGALNPTNTAAIADEVGDVLWYCAMLCEELGLRLDDVMRGNIDKLKKRVAEQTIKGIGDNR